MREAAHAKNAERIADINAMPRRREPRKVLLCRISALWNDRYGSSKSLSGLLEDRSRSGIAISLPEPIAIGTKVTIRGRRRELAGTVRYCLFTGAEYSLGVQLDGQDLDWDRFGAGL